MRRWATSGYPLIAMRCVGYLTSLDKSDCQKVKTVIAIDAIIASSNATGCPLTCCE
jgi:hypothetical protein